MKGDYFSDREREIDCRLKEWGYYYQHMLDGGLNYPKKNVLAKMMDGAIEQGGRAFNPADVPAHIQKIDQIVEQMRYALTSTHVNVLRIRYIIGNPVVDELQKIKLPRRTYEVRLREAKMWIMGKMDAY